MDGQWRQINPKFDGRGSVLSDDDICYYYLDNVAGGYSKSKANQLVFNLKKPIERKSLPDWSHKLSAIQSFGEDIALLLNGFDFSGYKVVLAAMPTSKNRNSSNYDDRIVQAIQIASAQTGIPYFDPFEIRCDMLEAHYGGSRSVNELRDNITINAQIYNLASFDICFLVDDMFTTGAHFSVCRDIVRTHCPSLCIAGAFWAKRVLT